jgi:hypothetical protein
MMHSSLRFKISQLRQEKVISMVESIAVFVFCLFITAFLPQILFKYIYANQQLTQEPPIFNFIQTGAFVVGAGYFLFAAAGNIARKMKIRALEKQLENMGDMGMDCCGGNCSCGMGNMDCCSNCDGEMCACDDHGSCSCGNCEVKPMGKSMSMEKNDAVMMMQKASKKKKK